MKLGLIVCLKTLVLASVLGIQANAQGNLSHHSYIELDGETQYLSIPSHRDFDILPGQSYTCTFWMFAHRTFIYGDPQRIMSRRDSSKVPVDSLNRSGFEVWGFRTTSNGLLGVSLPNASGEYTQSLEGWTGKSGGARLRSWYHCAVVVDRVEDKVKLYIDGIEVMAGANKVRSWVAQNNLPLFIGAGQREGKPYAYFGGRLDNIRFYGIALNPEQLKADRETETISPNTKGLLAGFDFEGLKPGDTSYTDVTGRHTATLHGFAERTGHSVVRTYTEQRTNGHLVGRGTNQALRTFSLGLVDEQRLEQIELVTAGAVQAKNVNRYSVYLTDNGDRFDPRNPGVLIAEGKPSTSGVTVLKARTSAPLLTQYSRLWLTADIHEKAREGDTITTQIKGIKLKGGEVFTPRNSAIYHHEIILRRTLVWTPGEDGSAHYRIPTLVRLDNGHLVAAIDRRKTTDYDLPSDIDVEVKISRDNGRSWSKPITIAKGTPEYGYGDAAMATDGKNIYVVMVAGSGLWYYPSHAKKPLDMYFSKSTDGGLTWSPVVEITSQVYTDRYPNGGFFGSGNGIVTSKGRIAFVASFRTDEKWGGNMDNAMVYSDDQGKTWVTAPVARKNGDESKIIELENGDLLISSRNRQWVPTPRTYTISKDHGTTWTEPQVWNDLVGNACNTALARYSLKGIKKADKNILLHTLIESPKRNHLRIYLSEDEGKTWPVGNTVCDGEAAYSEVTRLSNGNIGIISEENDRPAYDIYFTEVSLDWIRKGKPLKK